MPGSVAVAVPVGVLPHSLARAFSHSRQYTVRENNYRNGENQRDRLGANSRKSWTQARRLTAAQLTELRTFYLDHDGPAIPFVLYDPYDTSPQFSYDPTGVATVGRYVGRFDGAFESTVDVGARGNCGLRIIELAS